ncbi:MAG: TraR/DksA family transcriptional regulator [Planctomycetes bacterium]|nr:TraR/DksA family transcriptional regulator [Planctomycetota bacterium]
MTDDKIQEFRKQLSDMRDHLVHDKAGLLKQVQTPVGNTASNDIGSPSLLPETVGVSGGDEEVAIGLYDNVEHRHKEVVAALERITAGTFGVCQSCGKKIAQLRLKAIPYANLCTACARSQAAAEKK